MAALNMSFASGVVEGGGRRGSYPLKFWAVEKLLKKSSSYWIIFVQKSKFGADNAHFGKT